MAKKKSVNLRTLKVLVENPFRFTKTERNVFLSGPYIPREEIVTEVVRDCFGAEAVFKQHPLDGKQVVRIATKTGDTYLKIDFIWAT